MTNECPVANDERARSALLAQLEWYLEDKPMYNTSIPRVSSALVHLTHLRNLQIPAAVHITAHSSMLSPYVVHTDDKEFDFLDLLYFATGIDSKTRAAKLLEPHYVNIAPCTTVGACYQCAHISSKYRDAPLLMMLHSLRLRYGIAPPPLHMRNKFEDIAARVSIVYGKDDYLDRDYAYLTEQDKQHLLYRLAHMHGITDYKFASFAMLTMVNILPNKIQIMRPRTPTPAYLAQVSSLMGVDANTICQWVSRLDAIQILHRTHQESYVDYLSINPLIFLLAANRGSMANMSNEPAATTSQELYSVL